MWSKIKTVVNWFLGRFEHTLDPKGRIILPAKFRDSFARVSSYLSRNSGGCLALWTPEEFEMQAKLKLEEESSGDPIKRNLARIWAASVFEVKMDNQGRVPIPNHLREYASLKNAVIINGAMNRIEIWDPERWNAVETELGTDY